MQVTYLFLGEGEIPGLTDTQIPKKLGPKRASKIRKLFNLGPEDDVRKYVVRTTKAGKEGKHLFNHICFMFIAKFLVTYER